MTRIDDYKRSRQILFNSEGIKPQSKIIATNGPVKNVHYLEMGTGHPLILVHGGGSNSSEWFNILNPLSEHFHLYVVDRPGCGLTDAFDYSRVDVRTHAAAFIRAFMDAVNLDSAMFLAQSMGGYFSICFAMQYPERVKSLVLIGAPAGMSRWVPPLLRLLGTKGLNALLRHTAARPSIRNVKMIYRELLVADIAKLPEDYLQHIYCSQVLPDWFKSFSTLLENVLAVGGWKKELYIGDRLYHLNMPVRFIWGDRDAFEKPDSGLMKAKQISNYQFQIIENAGHCPWLDQPDACSAAVISMLKGVAV